MKKLSKSLLATVALCLLTLPLVMLDAKAVAPYDEEEFIVPIVQKKTVPAGYIGIYDASDFDAIRNALTSNYILMADIDLTEYGNWEPIGLSTAFSGHLDGNGHSISGLCIESNGTTLSSDLYLALFAVNSGTIENLRLIEPQISANYTGYSKQVNHKFSALIACNKGTCNNCVVSCCKINTDITWPYNYSPKTLFLGGVCGRNWHKISNCTVSGTIAVNDIVGAVGGVVGGGGEKSIVNCINKSRIEVTTKGKVQSNDGGFNAVGGVVGNGGSLSGCANLGSVKVTGYYSDSTFYYGSGISVRVGGVGGYPSDCTDCYNAGSVEASESIVSTGSSSPSSSLYLGGIAGDIFWIKNCYNVGTVKGTASAEGGSDPHSYEYIGAVAGYFSSYYAENVKNNYSADIGLMPFSSQSGTNCKILDLSAMQSKDSFAGFDFTEIWKIGNKNYPYPIIKSFEIDKNYVFVTQMLQYSLRYSDDETKESIQNAIYNILFKAQFRPNATSGIESDVDFGVYGGYATQKEANAAWRRHNGGGYGASVTDAVLGTYNIVGAAGCNAYARFVAAYVYGTTGSGSKKGGLSGENELKEIIHKYADPGEHLQIGGGSIHSVAFLGEDAAGTGFYYVDYGDAGGTNICNITLRYATYASFAASYSGYSFYVHDTNGGSYYSGGNVKSIADIRKNQITKIVKRVACPVEATVTLGNEILSSRAMNSTSFGSVTRDGEEIVFSLDYHEDYILEVEGTGEGTMTMTVDYYAGDEQVDERVFSNVPIRSTTMIRSGTIDTGGAYTLLIDLDGDSSVDSVWGAGINETVSEENLLFSEKKQTDGIDYANERLTEVVGVTIKDNSVCAIIHCRDGEDALVIYAAYDVNGQMLWVKSEAVPEADTTIIDSRLEGNEYSIQFFMLDGSWEPLCEAKMCMQ